MKDFLKGPFSYLLFALLVTGVYFVFFIQKGSFELFVNENHAPLMDEFFKYYTYLGDGAILGLILIIFLFYRFRLALITIFSIFFQSVFVSLFKRVIFNGLPRPIKFFGDHVSLHLVNGVDIHSINTFPSGHSTTAFALAALLALAFGQDKQSWGMVLFFMALLVGFSRVYLLQHFFIDIYGGALIGYLSVLFGIYIMERLELKYGTKRFESKLNFSRK